MRTHGVKVGLIISALLLGAATGAGAQTPPSPPEQGWIGIWYEVLEPRAPAAATEGAVMVVLAVQVASPAERAGLAVGDTVLRINDQRVSAVQMKRFAETLRPGDNVRLALRRDGRNRTVTVVAGQPIEGAVFFPSAKFSQEMVIRIDSVREAVLKSLDSVRANLRSVRFEFGTDSAEFARLVQEVQRMRAEQGAQRIRIEQEAERVAREAQRTRAERPVSVGAPVAAPQPFVPPVVLGQRVVAGAQLTALNAELAEYFGVRRGVLVTEVMRGTPAAAAGLVAGDVITAVEQVEIASVSDLRAALVRVDAPAVVTVIRKGRALQLRMPE
ncbi:MAG: PDZ domain-containing protein [Gemmatimonadetes bacterium]|nr:PDZ domain-containing protein [Gemmatimonadota bacterium]